MTDSDICGPDDRVARHYRALLAANYTWMLGGDIEATARDQQAILQSLVTPAGGAPRGVAVDLGCGSGAQTLALADLGYDPVLAVDTDPTLLAELGTHTSARPAVRTMEGDAVTTAADLEAGSVAVCVCMGDTLLHLRSATAVTEMFANVARALRPGGALLLSYRSLVDQRRGTDRFIPVRSDADRVMVCFLDFTDPDTVEVHDIVHARTANGWTMTASSYPKLRLSPAWITAQLTVAGLEVDHHEQGPSGMWRSLARRPAA